MLTKNELKYFSSLLKKKKRNEERKFLAEGVKVVEEGLKSSFICEIVIASAAFLEDHPDFLSVIREYNPRFEVISNRDFLKLSDTEKTQGIAAVFKMPEKYKRAGSINIITALDNVSDPGNAGTIIRTCDWFNVDTVILSGNSVDPYNSKVIRSTMGSLFHLPVITSDDFISEIKTLKQNGYSVLCADMNGKSVYGYKRPEKTVLVFSNEANGVSPEVKELCDASITIPGRGSAESLNVASAAAIIISELTR